MFEKVLNKFTYVQILKERNALLREGLDVASKVEFELRSDISTMNGILKNEEIVLADHKKMLDVMQEKNCSLKQQCHEKELQLLKQISELETQLEDYAAIIGFFTTYQPLVLIDRAGNTYANINHDKVEEFRGCQVVIESQPPSTKIFKVYVKEGKHDGKSM